MVPAPNGYFLYCITTVMIVKTISAREGLFSMLTNYHTHTTRCGHAEGTEEEYILTALRCGYKVLGFPTTPRGPTPRPASSAISGCCPPSWTTMS